MDTYEVGSRRYKPFAPYLIAEIGVNHGGSMVEAKDMISSAAKAGAHAVKFQSYTASKLAAPDYSPSYWDLKSEPTTSQFELFSRYDMFTLDHFRDLGDYAGSLGVDFLSTPFDLDIAEGLAEFVPAFKVASADLTNVPLVSGLLEFELPMILSTGAASTQEILAASELMKNYNSHAAFLHCVLNYPTQLKNANILGIRRLQESLPDNF
ncbi:N-acetylneuraminate synthase family protein, partial [Pontimonas sp.]